MELLPALNLRFSACLAFLGEQSELRKAGPSSSEAREAPLNVRFSACRSPKLAAFGAQIDRRTTLPLATDRFARAATLSLAPPVAHHPVLSGNSSMI